MTEHQIAYMKKWRAEHQQEIKAYGKRYHIENRERILPGARERARKRFLEQERGRLIKFEFIAEYGGHCACCGESNPLFLTIDHIHGRTDKKYRGWRLYENLKRAGWPKDGLRLLCFNCNSGRQINGGICPHETAKAQIA